jgi:hypothetical protein
LALTGRKEKPAVIEIKTILIIGISEAVNFILTIQIPTQLLIKTTVAEYRTHTVIIL